jgi:hypothetical protein
MRRLLMILVLCLLPGFAYAQQPSITITPPKVEVEGITLKQAAIVTAAVIAGAVVGQWLIGDVIGTAVGLVAGGILGLYAKDEFDPRKLF